MKRSLALLLTFIVCLSFAGSAFAAEKDGKTIFQGGDPIQCRENAGRCDPGNAPGGSQGG